MPTTHPPAFRQALLLIIAYVGFISLGLPDTLIGVAWPSVRGHFSRAQGDIAWVFLLGGLAYFFSSINTSRVLQRAGVGVLLAGSSALVAAGLAGFATAPLWALFAACALLHGLGSGAIDTGLNHYVAHHFSARHMNWLHACYSLGATLGPLIMTAVLAWSGGNWRLGYGVVGAMLGTLAMLFVLTRRQWGSAEPAPEEANQGWRHTMAHPATRLHIVIFFIYTGLEVTTGQLSYTVLTEARGVRPETAGLWVTLYWGSIGVGRLLFGFVVERLGIDRLLRGCLLMAALGAGLLAAPLPAGWSALALALIGLGLAPVFPCLITRTPQRVGASRSAQAIGFQVSAAMIGVAALPSLGGQLSQRLGLGTVPLLVLTLAVVLWALHEFLLHRDRRTA